MSGGQLSPQEATEQLSRRQQGQLQEQAATEEHNDRDEALLGRLRKQVSFYFSHQNLARDKYLRNILAAEHPDMPSPRPAQLTCPVGVITNFPKVRDICAQFEGREGQPPEPPALLLAKALEGSDAVTLSPDGNWIGPVLQQLPPPTMGGVPASMGGGPLVHHFQKPHQFQQQAPHLNYQQGSFPQPQPNPMPIMVPPGAPAVPYQNSGMPLPYPSPAHGVQYPNNAPVVNAAPIISLGGSESPSSASLESMPSQQQQATQQPQQGGTSNDNAVVVVMDLPPGAINPIGILSAFTTETIRPKSAFLDHHNTNLWFVSFGSEADAKAAILASANRTIAGVPVHAKLKNDLPASATASLSSASAPGQIAQQPQPVPLVGGVGYPLLPQGPSPPPPGMGPSPPPMGVTQTNMPVGYPPPYAIPPPQIQSPPQLSGMPPPGQPYPLHQPYYSPQQQMQQVYPGVYMQSQQQQGGLPQQQMMQPYPPPPQMGNRFGVVPPPPPLPRSGYPGGPPPPYPYQGMHQQYVDGNIGQHYQQHGHPHPFPRKFSDRRQGGPGSAGIGAGGFHDQGLSRTGKKKKKNQQTRRDSYGNMSNDNNDGFRRSNEYSNYGHQRHDNLTSPTLGDNQGGQKSSWKQKRGENDQQFRRSYGNASPSFHKNYNRNHHNSDRTSGSDTTPSAGLSGNRQGKSVDREIFNSSDFPGLSGLGRDDKSDKSNQQDNSKSSSVDGSSKHQLVGYASALLKKKAEDHKKEMDMVAPSSTDPLDNHEVDSITRQTEEMERQILSEFHDLSLIGDGSNTTDVALPTTPSPEKANNPQGSQHTGDTPAGADDKTEGTASSSTMDASARSPNAHNLPILPAGPFPENEVSGDTAPQTSYSTEVPPRQQQPQPPAIDVTSSQDFPSREPTDIVDDGAVAPLTKEQIQPTEVSSNDPKMHVVQTPKPPGAWGSKRFADVSVLPIYF